MTTTHRRAAIAILLTLTAAQAQADAYEAPERIHQAALSLALQANPAAQPADVALDTQLRLPACPDATLTSTWVREGTVEVGCASTGWRLFVPIRSQRRQPVLVLARPIAAGEAISAADVRLEERDTARIAPSAVLDIDAIAGRVPRRSLAAGSVLASTDLVAERTVRRGDEVTLLARTGGIEVRARGKALGEGGVQDVVRVENTQSRRVLSGRILQNGEVEVMR